MYGVISSLYPKLYCGRVRWEFQCMMELEICNWKTKLKSRHNKAITIFFFRKELSAGEEEVNLQNELNLACLRTFCSCLSSMLRRHLKTFRFCARTRAPARPLTPKKIKVHTTAATKKVSRKNVIELIFVLFSEHFYNVLHKRKVHWFFLLVFFRILALYATWTDITKENEEKEHLYSALRTSGEGGDVNIKVICCRNEQGFKNQTSLKKCFDELACFEFSWFDKGILRRECALNKIRCKRLLIL